MVAREVMGTLQVNVYHFLDEVLFAQQTLYLVGELHVLFAVVLKQKGFWADCARELVLLSGVREVLFLHLKHFEAIDAGE